MISGQQQGSQGRGGRDLHSPFFGSHMPASPLRPPSEQVVSSVCASPSPALCLGGHCGCGEEGLWSLEPPRHLRKQDRFPALSESCPVEEGDTTYFSVLPPPPQPTPLHSASPESHIQFPEWAMIV